MNLVIEDEIVTELEPILVASRRLQRYPVPIGAAIDGDAPGVAQGGR